MRLRTIWLGLVPAMLLAFGSTAQAAPVFFDFVGPCNGFNGGENFIGESTCSYYGLDQGDPVSGTLTIDSDYVVGGTSIRVDDLPGTAFSFTFGNQSWDLADLFDDFIEVTFNGDATLLTCLNGAAGCPEDPSDYAGFVNENEVALLAFHNVVKVGSFGKAMKTQKAISGAAVDGPPPKLPPAFAPGQWVRRDPTNPIPEPSAALLFVIGGAVVAASGVRTKR